MKPDSNFISYVVPNYVYGRRQGLIDEETEKLAEEAYSLMQIAEEKQVAKKPKKLSYELLIKHGWKYQCPECTKAIGLNSVGVDYTDDDPFCPSCGQKIDWSEEE